MIREEGEKERNIMVRRGKRRTNGSGAVGDGGDVDCEKTEGEGS